MAALFQRRQCHVQQNSPFLDLPAEIRNQIYQLALISPSPIDLWPRQHITGLEHFTKDAVLQERYSRWEPQRGRRALRNDYIYDELEFRVQHDLVQVRTQLATGLLGTCKQIHVEAANYFWGDNTWRFSDDEEWEGLLRFLLSIGPGATARIRRLDVLAPSASPDIPSRWSTIHVKNYPKMHLAKLHGKTLDRFDTVYALLSREKTIRELNFLVPASRSLAHAMKYMFEDQDIPDFHFTKVKIVVERGGSLNGGSEQIAEYVKEGWEVCGLPGSSIQEDGPIGIGTTKQQYEDGHRIWKPNSELERLIGLRQLFEEEALSVHASGGKAKPQGKHINTERELKGFGPCMIIVDPVPCSCWKCCRLTRRHSPIGVSYRSLVEENEGQISDWMESFSEWEFPGA